MICSTAIRTRQLGAFARDLGDFFVCETLAFAGAVVHAGAELEGGGFVHFAGCMYCAEHFFYFLAEKDVCDIYVQVGI